MGGGRNLIKDCCSIYYSGGNFMTREESIKIYNIGGFSPLLVYRACFYYKVRIPELGGASNQ